jgi:hypothetical protein
MKKFNVLFSFLVLSIFAGLSYGQILVENFDYPAGDSLTGHNWFRHSGTGTTILVTSGSLTYPGFPGSGIGNSVVVAGGGGSREDIHADFTPVGSGNLYTAFLVNVSTAATTGDYFFHLAPEFPTTFFKPRVFVKDDGAGNLQFGIAKAQNAGAVYTTTLYSYNTTYLLILKYEMPAGDSNDVAKLFINPSLVSEPPVADLTSSDIVADDSIFSVCLRQGSNAYSVQIDGIFIGTTYSEVTPVELSSFTAKVVGGNVVLNWQTASELNNQGFEVQRKSVNGEWISRGFVSGSGTTTETKDYHFTDNPDQNGKYSYRLKQVDFDGTFEYSKEVEVEIVKPVSYELGQNYPNPFNPSTTIKFSMPEAGNVKLVVYNLLGQEVKSLVNGFMQSGTHIVNFDASNLNSGMYLYRLNTGTFTEVRKMTLIK